LPAKSRIDVGRPQVGPELLLLLMRSTMATGGKQAKAISQLLILLLKKF
jgi:hypothetical protein